jgi:hypothetical protein
MRERREIPKIEEGEVGVLILREGMGELLELLQCSLLTHFGDGGRDGGVVGDSLRCFSCHPVELPRLKLLGCFSCLHA